MSTLKVTNVAHETSTLNTLVFDNGGGSGNGRVTTKGTIGEITAISYASTITLDFRTGNNFSTTLTGNVSTYVIYRCKPGRRHCLDSTNQYKYSCTVYWKL
jgi:hypothetical protein